MIFPWLNFILLPSRAPITWALAFINIIAFVFTNDFRLEAEVKLNRFYRDPYFLNTQGAVYAKFILRNPASYSELSQEKASHALSGDRNALQSMAASALRDANFLNSLQTLPMTGDTVAVKLWQRKIKALRETQSQHPDTEMAFISSQPKWLHALTYQFTHANLWHLFSNLLFLLLLGCFLEPLIGSGALLLCYLICGNLGALIYLVVGGASATPMIGASGSISGLFGLFGGLLRRKSVKFYFFILPFEGYSGFVYLPAWILLAHRIVVDLTGYLSTVDEIGSTTAFTTHLGGMLAGAVLAALVFRRDDGTSYLTQR